MTLNMKTGNGKVGRIAVYFEQHSVVQAEKQVGQRTDLRRMHVSISFQALKGSKICHNTYDKTGSVVWSGNMDVDKERRTSSANF